jgi:DNA-binding transcriptional ArsR family regulator/uncharacterized protein YndB with AHSA1/START domain
MSVTQGSAFWQAVAHPVRRRLIELLAEGPRTTGDLARGFPVTRFAVMKHLGVLERGGLISVRREGRVRWNVLTLAPALVPAVLGRPGIGAGAPAPPPEPAGRAGARRPPLPFLIEQTVQLDASPGRIFDALTLHVSGWWGAPYLRSHDATRVLLEPLPGGRLLEEWGHRQGFVRGIVTALRQDERLELTGRLAGGDPLPSLVEIALSPGAGGTTRLAFSHRGAWLQQGEGTVTACAAAWRQLLGVRLKAFVERGVRSGIAELPPTPDTRCGWF